MRKVLKIAIKANAAHAAELRYEERHSLHVARNSMDIFRRDEEKYQEDEKTADFHYDRYWNLHQKRTHELRKEQRAAFVAYAFIRGVPYSVIETKAKNPVNLNRVMVVAKSHFEGTPQEFAQNWERFSQEIKGVQNEPQKTA